MKFMLARKAQRTQGEGRGKQAGKPPALELVETPILIRKVSYEQVAHAIMEIGPFKLKSDGVNIRNAAAEIGKHLEVEAIDVFVCLRAKPIKLPKLITLMRMAHVKEQVAMGKPIEQISLETGQSLDILERYAPTAMPTRRAKRVPGIMEGVEELRRSCANPQPRISNLSVRTIVRAIDAIGPSVLLAKLKPNQPPIEAVTEIAKWLCAERDIIQNFVPAERQVLAALPPGVYIEDLIREAVERKK